MGDDDRIRVLDALLGEGGVCSLVPQVPGLAPEEALFIADQLVQLGWVNADVYRLASGAAHSIINLRITPVGRAAARDLRLSRASGNESQNRKPLDQSISAKRIRRAQFLGFLYTAVCGSEANIVSHSDIGGQLEWSLDETEEVANYLERGGLLRSWAEEGAIGITHAGITEYEQLTEAPDEPTPHFPAQNEMTCVVDPNDVSASPRSSPPRMPVGWDLSD